jgi:uncharacterized protein RhaS with RHS repeats
VANFSYTYDGIGQLTGRGDVNTSLSETFAYDSLNRMTSAVVVNLSLSKSFGYDTIGNLITESDVGTYVYPTAGTPLPHAVSSISGTVNTFPLPMTATATRPPAPG